MLALKDKVAIVTRVSSALGRSAPYLASDTSSFATGTALLVDGGVSIARG